MNHLIGKLLGIAAKIALEKGKENDPATRKHSTTKRALS
jgi:hypothetical protein